MSGVTIEQLGTNYTAGTVLLRWNVPTQSNGMIVTYTVRYKRMDVENSIGTDLCIVHTPFTNASREYIIKSLDNGNYSFKVMATSFAGAGPWSLPVNTIINVN